ncbi:transcriptional regulator, TetR family [Sporobacter termitidis DSM 10068]|uniref:Transcriptional regulator, TetR family n=1 Tax=Sporobacter termitidis DSM 10068 TaxID=1123282 RepID=A0A1M5X608_9FIRM|nr:TetR/AcrR family transcriptional regulator [Sporobacter termitidis]SHH94643.1 transcriptional regulator, TetR family [Sporobacter termitidis DSM 10068]
MAADKNYHHGDLKGELIREGLKILDTEGYDGLSLRKVAKACNVSQTAPYRHFKSKDELIGAITLQAMQLFNASLRAAVSMYPGDARRQLKEMGVAYVRFFRENPDYLRLLFFSNIREKLDKAVLEEWDRQFNGEYGDEHPYKTFYEAVARYKKDCTEEAMTQDELVLLCWGLVHGLSALLTSGELDGGDKSLALIESMIRGRNFLG